MDVQPLNIIRSFLFLRRKSSYNLHFGAIRKFVLSSSDSDADIYSS